MITNIKNIEIERIHKHPNNPRKDLGDLTELAASIKECGVLQNLTVVPAFSMITGSPTPIEMVSGKKVDKSNPYYTVVIGHRRLAAAKMAGLKEVPCVVSDMNYKDQIATMLLENIQRTDLTVYEQAQGFQMMLDLGETVGSISKKSGFSETTVRRRVNLLDLDQQLFEKTIERGATLMDYIELDKINDVDRKNEVLKSIGTKNFEHALRNAIDTEKRLEDVERIIEQLNKFAEEIDDTKDLVYVGYFNVGSEEEVEVPEDADTVKYYYTSSPYSIRVYREVTEADEEEETEEEETEEEREKRERREKLDALSAVAYNLRQAFVKNFKPQKKHSQIIAAFAAGKILQTSHTWNFDSNVIEFLGISLEEHQQSKDVILQMIEESPERMLFVMSYLRISNYASDRCHDYLQMYCVNEKINSSYAILEKLGYVMSDEEKALLDGTHELYRPEDPCYRCKSSRSHCDDCCKTCENRCNGAQRCRMPEEETEQ